MEKSIQYMRKVAVLEVVHKDNLNKYQLSQNPDSIKYNDTRGRSLYGASYHHTPTHQQQWPEKIERNKDGVGD